MSEVFDLGRLRQALDLARSGGTLADLPPTGPLGAILRAFPGATAEEGAPAVPARPPLHAKHLGDGWWTWEDDRGTWLVPGPVPGTRVAAPIEVPDDPDDPWF